MQQKAFQLNLKNVNEYLGMIFGKDKKYNTESEIEEAEFNGGKALATVSEFKSD